jgi:serine/threonine protein kinase
MEYVDGPSLREKIADGPLPLRDALGTAAEVAQALEAAHRSGIVHRDIKPANILLTSEGRAKVLDFGLARLADAADLTAPGSTVGTAAYMSPEQARGSRCDPES